jgi:hypothetical protein
MFHHLRQSDCQGLKESLLVPAGLERLSSTFPFVIGHLPRQDISDSGFQLPALVTLILVTRLRPSNLSAWVICALCQCSLIGLWKVDRGVKGYDVPCPFGFE